MLCGQLFLPLTDQSKRVMIIFSRNYGWCLTSARCLSVVRFVQRRLPLGVDSVSLSHLLSYGECYRFRSKQYTCSISSQIQKTSSQDLRNRSLIVAYQIHAYKQQKIAQKNIRPTAPIQTRAANRSWGSKSPPIRFYFSCFFFGNDSIINQEV